MSESPLSTLIKTAAAQRGGLDPTADMFEGQSAAQAGPLDPSAADFGAGEQAPAETEDAANVDKANQAAVDAGMTAQQMSEELEHDKAIAEADIASKEAEIAKAQAVAAKAEVKSRYARPKKKKAKDVEQEGVNMVDGGQDGAQKAARLESFERLVGMMKEAGMFDKAVGAVTGKVKPAIDKVRSAIGGAISPAAAPKPKLTQADIDAIYAQDSVLKGIATKRGLTTAAAIAKDPAVLARRNKLLARRLIEEGFAPSAAAAQAAPAAAQASKAVQAIQPPAPGASKVGWWSRVGGGESTRKALASQYKAKFPTMTDEEILKRVDSDILGKRIATGAGALGLFETMTP